MTPIEHAYEFLTEARKVPNFATSDERLSDEGGWMIALIGGTHRDCTTLDRANAAEICAQLVEACGGIESIGRTFDYMRASHWAVGWYEHLIVDPTDERVMRVIGECGCALADYPVLCEQRFSEMEIVDHDDGTCGEDCPFTHCSDCATALHDHARGDRCMSC